MVNNHAALDRRFHALAHPARRRIVERLARGATTVGEASRGLAVSKPAVTKHVKILEGAGIVVRTIAGRTHTLRLADDGLVQPAAWIESQRELWEAKFDEIERLLAERRSA
jgi:DNA-binding transcriptional ArsR family regulator